MKRKKFGKVFEGKKIGTGIPMVKLRRLTDKDWEKYREALRPGHTVGVFHGESAIAFIDFDDIFDEEGNRFYND